MIKKIPNILTIGRIIIVPFFVLAFYLPGFYGDLTALILFIVASFTDFLDGMLARMFGVESKFGELLDEKKPLLLVFFSEFDELSNNLHPILKDVAAALGDKGKVIKINTEKNIKLSEALRVKVIPTLMIYKFGEMVWRQSGDQDANTLISLMKDQLN